MPVNEKGSSPLEINPVMGSYFYFMKDDILKQK
jgi:hypothetical protein